LVYDELRRLAAEKLAHENPGQTLQATALVHEAYLRLVGNQRFNGRGHFFAAGVGPALMTASASLWRTSESCRTETCCLASCAIGKWAKSGDNSPTRRSAPGSLAN
jgi:hypothetical protein